MLKSINKNAED